MFAQFAEFRSPTEPLGSSKAKLWISDYFQAQSDHPIAPDQPIPISVICVISGKGFPISAIPRDDGDSLTLRASKDLPPRGPVPAPSTSGG